MDPHRCLGGRGGHREVVGPGIPGALSPDTRITASRGSTWIDTSEPLKLEPADYGQTPSHNEKGESRQAARQQQGPQEKTPPGEDLMQADGW